MTISTQEKSLMLLVEDYHKNECQKLLSSAHDKVTMMLHKAFHKAREYVHETIESERQRSTDRIQAAQSELQTQQRKHSRQADTMILELGRKRIKQQLLHHWQSSSSRQIWISKAINSALKCLPQGHWQVHHPVDWSNDETQIVMDMTQLHSIELYFQSNTTIKSGLKIEVASTVLDMTDHGLLADEYRLESRLLALFHQVYSS